MNTQPTKKLTTNNLMTIEPFCPLATSSKYRPPVDSKTSIYKGHFRQTKKLTR
jgi:hypothetical protein